jgi:hypothetical protein
MNALPQANPFLECFAPRGQKSLFGSLTQKPTPLLKNLEHFQFVHQIYRNVWIMVHTEPFYRFLSPKSQKTCTFLVFVEIRNFLKIKKKLKDRNR